MNWGYIGIFIIVAVILVAGVGFFKMSGKAIENRENKIVMVETNKGAIKIELYSKDMPITAGNFEKLVREGFYDGILFHRVIEGFMIQSGDPLTKDPSKKGLWGSGGPGYSIQDEFKGNQKNERGILSMANAGPNTGGSQFFINLVGNGYLDGKHPVFGKVVEGMDIVDSIGKVETDLQDRPVQEVRIITAKILK